MVCDYGRGGRDGGMEERDGRRREGRREGGTDVGERDGGSEGRT